MYDSRKGVSTGYNVSAAISMPVGGNSEFSSNLGVCQSTDSWRTRANSRKKVVTIKQVEGIRTWVH